MTTLCCVHVIYWLHWGRFISGGTEGMCACGFVCVRSAHVFAVAISSPVRVLPIVPVACLLQGLFITILLLSLSFRSLILLCITIHCE